MSAADQLPFEFGGRRCLDFTWTLRFRAVYPTDLLSGPTRLTAWLSAAGLPSGRAGPNHLAAARELREAIYATALDAIDGTPPQPRRLSTINRWAATEHTNPRLLTDGTITMAVRRGRETEAGLTTIAFDAINLLGSGDGRIRRCEGPSCSLLFHDTSRPGTRRWCSAERCGNKVNTKNYRTRLDE
jgi:predicted RNA-binding Zn ribbon-like protein